MMTTAGAHRNLGLEAAHAAVSTIASGWHIRFRFSVSFITLTL